MKLLTTITAVLALTIATTSCTKKCNEPVPAQNNSNNTITALEDWGKHRNYISPTEITDEEPYNLYDGVEGDPVTVRPIATADGPRYIATDGTGRYFNGEDWDDAFPGLADMDNSADLAKLQSGDYYLWSKKEGDIHYFEVWSAEYEELDFVLEFRAIE